MSTTCKDLSTSSKPFIYHKISLDWTTRPLRRLLQLLRRIFQDPEAASYIQHVSFLSLDSEPWQDTQPEINWEEESTSFQDVISQSIEIVHRAQFPNPDTWHLPIQGGNIYCFAAIFISQLPNIKSIRLDYSLVWWDGFTGIMLKQALLSPNGILSTFQHLETVDYGANVPIAENEDMYSNKYPDSYPPYNPDQFMAWFCLPSLRYLRIWLRDIGELQESKFDLDLSKLETLVLARTTISEKEINFLLSRTPNLKNLHLGMAYRYGTQLVLNDAPMLAQALVSVSQTVEHLSLGMEYYPSNLGDRYWYEVDDHIREPFLNILNKFPNLQSAEMPLCVLMGWYVEDAAELGSLLPKPLRKLVLRDDMISLYDFDWEEDYTIDLLYRFLPNVRTYTPSLEMITLRVWDQNHTDYYDEQEEQLSHACAKVGLTLDVIVDDLGSERREKDKKYLMFFYDNFHSYNYIACH
ncbi:hypothetical protein BDV38DRAFT_284444 [Aspergillus pseudotamarii]|uniref:F-box domain-containing protein n=1 Tax=Aspergillus pseudotamarii TaxID=132259 RepID=A0A5N6SQ50_ASPPS|nr:uncharacterized protein BDV38DRAFT_284444 [Aspergillus pseudotamarii]KAE8135969.1 hypothetical protein BDV38DRAFT_284444 [Aspergillus pseudotamarii]